MSNKKFVCLRTRMQASPPMEPDTCSTATHDCSYVANERVQGLRDFRVNVDHLEGVPTQTMPGYTTPSIGLPRHVSGTAASRF